MKNKKQKSGPTQRSVESQVSFVSEYDQRSKEFENLVTDHMDILYAVALRFTHNTADAEDLVQNTVVKALKSYTKFEEGTFIKAWLLTILRNTFINDYRRTSRRPLHVELTGIEPAANTYSPDPIVRTSQGDLSLDEPMELFDDEVRSAVENLPDNFRSAVIMADVEDKSYKEISDVMDCPIGTVMSRIYRGRELLRRDLHDYARDFRLVGNA